MECASAHTCIHLHAKFNIYPYKINGKKPMKALFGKRVLLLMEIQSRIH